LKDAPVDAEYDNYNIILQNENSNIAFEKCPWKCAWLRLNLKASLVFF